MNLTLDHTHHRPAVTIAAAAVATVVALGVLGGVAVLFQSRGEPFAEAAAAERVCAQLTYASDRRSCVQRWIAERAAAQVAKR